MQKLNVKTKVKNKVLFNNEKSVIFRAAKFGKLNVTNPGLTLN